MWAVCLLAALGTGATLAEDVLPGLCPLVLHEEQLELDELELEVELARSALEAYEEIFLLIDKLWQSDATERLLYLRAKHDRDASRLALERADLVLERQRALLEQFRLACSGDAGDARERARATGRAHRRYREADCAAQVKTREIARTKLAFQREWLASVLELRKNSVGTRQDVILAELGVEQEERRLADATQRAEACRRALDAGKSRPEN